MIVATSLPAIERDLGASLKTLEWTVNAATLTFAVLLLAGAALGDRFGRRRMFVAGIALLTAGSAAGALAPSAALLVGARAVQGLGGALIAPLSLTLLSAATPPARRGAVLGAWGAVAAAAAATGPVLGGILTDALSWHWVFWVNVPVGLVLIPLAARGLAESHGPHGRLDVAGIALSGAALLAIVWALIEAGAAGWGAPRVLLALAAGGLLLACFAAWELRAPAPMLPPRFFRKRVFGVASAICLTAYFGLLGALFVIAQLLQTGLGATPLQAGLGLIAMSAPMALTSPYAGALCDRIGPRRLLTFALALGALSLAGLGVAAAPGVTYLQLAPGLALVGVSAATLFAPIQATLLGAVAPAEQGQASGAATAQRELGGVLGVAVLGAVFAAHGGAGSSAAFLAGARPALFIAALALAAAMLLALALPGGSRRAASRPAPLPTARFAHE
jgi:EmrB/QacA subfamily drug resistance transporter